MSEEPRLRNIYGIDYASKNDFFAVVLHQLPEFVADEEYLPKLKTVRKYPHTNYAEMLEILEQDLFRRFPPFYIVPDYTSEKTFTDILTESYGKDAIEPIVFGNSTKKMLKEDGLSIMSQGYKFPNPAQIENKYPILAEWIRGMINELLREQIITTKANNITFDHPVGEHNDLAIAWELSIHGCLRWSLRPRSEAALYSGSGKTNPKKMYDNPEEMIKEIKNNPKLKLDSVAIQNPTDIMY